MDPELTRLILSISQLGYEPTLGQDSQGRLILQVVLSRERAPSTPADAPPSPDRGSAGREAEPEPGTSPRPENRALRAPRGNPEGPPPGCSHLVPRLQPLGETSVIGRLWRAYRLGQADGTVAAAAQNGGSAIQEPSPPLPGSRAGAYVVLTVEGQSEARITRNTRTYYELTHDLQVVPAVWLPQVVSRSLPTLTEAEAYCRGAGLEGLPLEV